ncbi:DUF308 domain-containing protein [Nocardia mangyaensis]|uniref:DUF308 domain-containing protein n=1 Tax=Nocardia mangyaensis TaxID=2213200 RepID=UPI00267717C4|nr:DUF308 domain-containing protein [Nocardia mangyaensis]MDO3646431.1 DUF308 domain-containing protein [Nocardia mangyaensis]
MNESAAGQRTRQALLIAGGASFVLGVATLLWPGRDESTLALMFGISLLVGAGVQTYLGFRSRIAVVLGLLVLVSAALTAVLAVLSFGGGSIELLAWWIGLGWAVRGVVQALVGVWDEQISDGWLHEISGLVTLAIGVAIIAITFKTVTGLATVAGGALVVIGVLDLLTGGLLRAGAFAGRDAAVVDARPVSER